MQPNVMLAHSVALHLSCKAQDCNVAAMIAAGRAAHTLHPHRDCSPESCEIAEVRKHESDQAEEIARLESTHKHDEHSIDCQRSEIEDLRKELKAKYPGSPVSTLHVHTPDAREVDGAAGVSPSDTQLLREAVGCLLRISVLAQSTTISEVKMRGNILEQVDFAIKRINQVGDVGAAWSKRNQPCPNCGEDGGLAPGGWCGVCDFCRQLAEQNVSGYAISNEEIAKIDGKSMEGGHADPTPGSAGTLGDSPSSSKELGPEAENSETAMPVVSIAAIASEGSAGADGLDRDSHPRADGGEVSTTCAATNASRQSDAADHLSPTESPRADQRGCGLVGSGTDAVPASGIASGVEAATVPDAVCGDSVTSRILPGEEYICTLAKGHVSDHENGDGASWTSPTDAERGIDPVASDLALRDGVAPAVPENGEGSTEAPKETPSASHHEENGQAAQGTGHPEEKAVEIYTGDTAPRDALADELAATDISEQALLGSETIPAHDPSISTVEHEETRGQELSGASHPGVSIANSNLEKPVATGAGLAPESEVSGSADVGGRLIAQPVSVPTQARRGRPSMKRNGVSCGGTSCTADDKTERHHVGDPTCKKFGPAKEVATNV